MSLSLLLATVDYYSSSRCCIHMRHRVSTTQLYVLKHTEKTSKTSKRGNIANKFKISFFFINRLNVLLSRRFKVFLQNKGTCFTFYRNHALNVVHERHKIVKILPVCVEMSNMKHIGLNFFYKYSTFFHSIYCTSSALMYKCMYFLLQYYVDVLVVQTLRTHC